MPVAVRPRRAQCSGGACRWQHVVRRHRSQPTPQASPTGRALTSPNRRDARSLSRCVSLSLSVSLLSLSRFSGRFTQMGAHRNHAITHARAGAAHARATLARWQWLAGSGSWWSQWSQWSQWSNWPAWSLFVDSNERRTVPCQSMLTIFRSKRAMVAIAVGAARCALRDGHGVAWSWASGWASRATEFLDAVLFERRRIARRRVSVGLRLFQTVEWTPQRGRLQWLFCCTHHNGRCHGRSRVPESMG